MCAEGLTGDGAESLGEHARLRVDEQHMNMRRPRNEFKIKHFALHEAVLSSNV
jgi:hypothetical protein